LGNKRACGIGRPLEVGSGSTGLLCGGVVLLYRGDSTREFSFVFSDFS
jgi:hypothetical protein